MHRSHFPDRRFRDTLPRRPSTAPSGSFHSSSSSSSSSSDRRRHSGRGDRRTDAVPTEEEKILRRRSDPVRGRTKSSFSKEATFVHHGGSNSKNDETTTTTATTGRSTTTSDGEMYPRRRLSHPESALDSRRNRRLMGDRPYASSSAAMTAVGTDRGEGPFGLLSRVAHPRPFPHWRHHHDSHNSDDASNHEHSASISSIASHDPSRGGYGAPSSTALSLLDLRRGTTANSMASDISAQSGFEFEEDDEDAAFPLFIAASKGHAEIVTTLLLSGMPINAKRSKDGATPLHIAVKRGHLEVVKTLVKSHASLEARTHDDMTPLCLAASLGFRKIVHYLIEKGAKVEKSSALLRASSEGHADVVERLLEESVSLNELQFLAPAHRCAIERGHVDVASMIQKIRILKKRAADADGESPVQSPLPAPVVKADPLA